MFLKLRAKNYKILLSCYKWKKRLLILISPRQDTRISQLYGFIATHQTELDERCLIIKRFTINEINFGSDTEQIGFWLIGYDGNIKGHGLHSDFLNQIFSTIDEMPIRMQEKKL